MNQAPLETMRHSAAHLLALAVQKIFPGVKLGIGPAIDEGFYYDFDFREPITKEDLEKIASLMTEEAKKRLKFEKSELSISDAKNFFKNEPYKLELISDLEKEGEKKVSVYKSGDFVDLCAGPHVENTFQIGPFKLLSLAGAYWRGSEKNKMLTRIYGTCFATQRELDHYLWQIEEAKKRDHRKLGKELELFYFHETAPGMPYWLPKGLIIYNELVNFWREEHLKRGYLEIKSPLINLKKLYQISGHWDHYREAMFISETPEKEIYGLKPMNCPNAMVIYGSRPRSYKELPLRLADTDTLHRFEKSGVLSGLLRVREFSQDDAHIFLKEDQIEQEYRNIFEIVDLFYSVFKMKVNYYLSTRPDDFMGGATVWAKAEKILADILKNQKIEYQVKQTDGAFYGPKVDIHMNDVLGRTWQMGTIQLDFNIPQRFNLTYVDNDGKPKPVVCIHRVIYGSLERFIGILIEHFGGAFPTWLSPIQAMIIPVADRHIEYGQKIVATLKKQQIRSEIDTRNETLQAKIRDATLQKVPYMVIIGDREVKNGKISIRTREGKDLGESEVESFLKKIKLEI